MENDLFLWSDRNSNKHPLVNLQSNNCDFKNPEKFSDLVTITQMDLLPITSVSYGPITYELQEVFEASIEHIQEDMKEQKMAQRHTNETLEKFNGKLNGILVKWLNSTLGNFFNS
jgi:phosphoribosyl-dephospho-CoA transferase